MSQAYLYKLRFSTKRLNIIFLFLLSFRKFVKTNFYCRPFHDRASFNEIIVSNKNCFYYPCWNRLWNIEFLILYWCKEFVSNHRIVILNGRTKSSYKMWKKSDLKSWLLACLALEVTSSTSQPKRSATFKFSIVNIMIRKYPKLHLRQKTIKNISYSLP